MIHYLFSMIIESYETCNTYLVLPFKFIRRKMLIQWMLTEWFFQKDFLTVFDMI